MSEIAPLLIVIKLEQFDYAGGDRHRPVMLLISFVILLVRAIWSRAWQRRRFGR